jgi:glutamate dehydrogenase (NAD(P)+)
MRSRQEVTIERRMSGFEAYLVVEASDKNLSFGGTRIDPSVTRDMVVDLAENMSLKLAGHGSPVGGAKAGLQASPDDPRLKQFLNRFAEECRDLLSSTTILGKDMGAKQWMLDEIYGALNMPQLAVARKHSGSTRCPDRLADLDGYIKNMTGQGVFWSIEQALRGRLRGVRVLIQGFGVVGSGVAWYLHGSGAKIVGVSDRLHAVLGSDGLDFNSLMAAKDDNGILVEQRLPRSCVLADRDELLAQSADVLVLAAGSYLVDGDSARRIQTPLVIEGANLALMPAARSVLHALGVRVVPDVVANSSSAAMVGHQIASGNTISQQVLWADIEANIRRNTDAVDRISKELDIDPKSAFRRIIQGERRC